MLPVAKAQGLGAAETAALYDLETIFSNIVKASIPLSGIALFLMLLMGGFKLITSGSDPKKAQSAKNTITFALIGITLVAMAYLILVIISNLTGQNSILEFDIYRG